MKKVIGVFVICATLALLFPASGCDPKTRVDDPVLQKSAEELTEADMARLSAVVKTNFGSFRIKLHPEWAPENCRHFIKLVKQGFYDGLTFHEIRPGFWIEGGCPLGTGEGGPGYGVALESPSAPHIKGAVGFDRNPLDEKSEAGSVFYVTLRDLRLLRDGLYSVFGEVDEGMATVERIGALEVTPKGGKPRPYMPLTPVKILDINLQVNE